jgi:type III restriction enzyme
MFFNSKPHLHKLFHRLLEYCKYASEYTSANEGKPWKYVLIPHNAVQTNMSFKYLVEQFEIRQNS